MDHADSIIASAGRSGVRTITDIDVLAFRFLSGSPVPELRGRRAPQGLHAGEDPGLGIPDDSIDMIIGEVKEGRVGVNTAVRDPDVLKVVIGRLGDSGEESDRVIHQLLQHCAPRYLRRPRYGRHRGK